METPKLSMAKIASSNEMVPVTNITDLCTLCLLKVFDYLDVMDLSNLVEANIVRKLGKRNRKKMRYQESIVASFKIKVEMNKRKTFASMDHRSAPKDIKMLRSFGRQIESLYANCRIDYMIFEGNNIKDMQNRRYERALEDAIIGNCSKTLIGISFNNCNKDTMKELDRPFDVVQSVDFYYGHLGNTLGQLKKWFPKMIHLNFDNTYVFNPKCIHERFSDLKSLTVSNPSRRDMKLGKEIFSYSNLEIFLQMNPQLETLNICHDDIDETASDGGNGIVIDWNLMTCISKKSKLKELTLNLECFRSEDEWPSTIAFDSLTTLNVESSECYYLNTIQMTSANLKELTVKMSFRQGDMVPRDYEAMVAFVVRTAPKQLNIIVEYRGFDVNNAQVVQMPRILPELQELYIECSWVDNIPDAVLSLLANGTGSALNKLIGAFDFDGDDNGDPSLEYLQMRQVFREKIVRNDFVTNNWSYKFNYKDDDCFYVDSIEFKKIK